MDFAIIGVPYDKTQTLRKGAALGPKILRRVFPKLETYIFGVELTEQAFLHDLGDVKGKNLIDIEDEIRRKLRATKKRPFPILLGGEHTITAAGVEVVKPDKVVVFDAHADCEDSKGHDGIVRRLIKMMGRENVFLYGVRVASKREDRFIKENKVNIVDFKTLRKLKGKIYLSVDFDVLDPSVIASVGNPEPMGLSFAEVSEAIRTLADKLVGADFVEFTPLKTDEMGIHALVAGKLIYATMAGVIKARM